jgi:hypothetical protein
MQVPYGNFNAEPEKLKNVYDLTFNFEQCADTPIRNPSHGCN